MEQLSQFAIHHWELCSAFIAVSLLVYINELVSLKKAPMSLSPQLTIEKINHDDATILDLRSQELFSSGHIINAMRVSAEDFSQPRLQKYKDKPIILVCAKGIESQTLATKLKSQGFTESMVLSGGITAWQVAGLPLIKGNK